MPYQSTKTYGHNLGLSVAFRQHKATSHCRHIHGYALEVKLTFQADELDDDNWVVDFGGLKEIKKYLETHFDHRLLVAEDDPQLLKFKHLAQLDVANVLIVAATGCEAFAKMIYDYCEGWLHTNDFVPRVALVSVEVREHSANSAIYTG
jgi:6-pyruvoyltetrahydropterin/6-carboxytetrahydropterin synthase